MSVIAFILKPAFFLFIASLVIILWVVFAFYKRMTRACRQFNPNSHQYQEPSSTKNTIIGNCPMEECRKQVTLDSEGEHVDFTESDDTQS